MGRRDQRMASTAWLLVEGVVAATGTRERSEFRARAAGLPAMLQGSGLAATAAFLRAKSIPGTSSLERAYGSLVGALEERVFDALGVAQDERPSFIGWLGQASVGEYRRAGAVAREFAAWMRRATEALIEEPAGAGDGEH